jgi:hypothetical protein
LLFEYQNTPEDQGTRADLDNSTFLIRNWHSEFAAQFDSVLQSLFLFRRAAKELRSLPTMLTTGTAI